MKNSSHNETRGEAKSNPTIEPRIVLWSLSLVLSRSISTQDDSSQHVMAAYESEHPYRAYSDKDVKVIELMFARSISVKFDSRCCTDCEDDVLTFFTDESCLPQYVARNLVDKRELRFS